MMAKEILKYFIILSECGVIAQTRDFKLKIPYVLAVAILYTFVFKELKISSTRFSNSCRYIGANVGDHFTLTYVQEWLKTSP